MKKAHITRENIDLFIFDLDGTLVESRSDISKAINEALVSVGEPRRPVSQIHPLIGKPLDEIFEILLPRQLRHLVEEAAERYRTYYFENCARDSYVYPGAVRCLEELADKRLAVATTKKTFQARRVVQLFGLGPCFEVVQGSDDIAHKPDPAVIELVLKKTQVPPDRALMIGDTVMDIRAGRAAGTYTCAVTYGIGVGEDLQEAKPDILLEDLGLLTRVLTNDGQDDA